MTWGKEIRKNSDKLLQGGQGGQRFKNFWVTHVSFEWSFRKNLFENSTFKYRLWCALEVSNYTSHLSARTIPLTLVLLNCVTESINLTEKVIKKRTMLLYQENGYEKQRLLLE